MADTPKYYVESATGQVRTVTDPEQAQQLAVEGRRFLGSQEAGQAYGQELDRADVEQKFGTVGQIGLGMLDQGGFGILPSFGAFGTSSPLSPENLWMMQAAQSNPAFRGGQLAANLPLFLESGPIGAAGSWAERLAAAGLPEVTSALGRVGKSALSMAARGSAEGALIGVNDAISQNIIQNAPLSAQAIAAHGAEGALFGGLFGGAIGGAGRGLGEAFEGAVGGVARTSGKGVLLRHLGATPQDLLRMEAEGGLNETLGKFYEQLQAGGKNFRTATSEDMAQIAKSWMTNSRALKADMAELLQREAPGLTPSYTRIQRGIEDILAPYLGTMEQREASGIASRLSNDVGNIKGKPIKTGIYEDVGTKIEGVYEPRTYSPMDRGIQSGIKALPGKAGQEHVIDTELKFHPAGTIEQKVGDLLSGYEKATWKQWFDSRDYLRGKIGNLVGDSSLAKKLESDVLTLIDKELTSSLEAASETTSRKGLAAQWASATAAERMAQHIEEMSSRKASEGMLGGRMYLTPGDMKTIAMGAGFGGPAGALKGASIVAAKGLGSVFQDWIEPILAQKAYEATIGLKAAGAVASTRNQIRSGVRKFFEASGSNASRGATVVTSKSRQEFDKKLERANQLVSPMHQERVKQYVDMVIAAQQERLAQELLLTNLRASQYLQYNMPPSAKTQASTSLRQQPTKWGLDAKEWKFDRIFGAVTDPKSLINHLEDGSLTSEEVKAVKYVYPDLHQEMVSEIANGIVELKSEGKYLPVDKITTLGLALDAPIDPILEGKFIGEVQASLALPPPGQEPEQVHQQPIDATQNTINTGLLTPIQQAIV